MGYTDQESSGSRSHPGFKKESQQFRIELRKAGFVNPLKDETAFKSFDGKIELSEKMKLFSTTARARRESFIRDKLSLQKSSRSTRPIPVSTNEERHQSTEQSLSKTELLSVIQALIESLNVGTRPQLQKLHSIDKEELLLICNKLRILQGK